MNLLFLVLAAFLLYTIYRIVVEVLAQREHLTDETIRALMHGKLRKNEEAYRRALIHLGTCQKCQAKLHNYNGDEDIQQQVIDDLHQD
ncbi:MAG: hypothetical protein KDC28_16890 [Saprospiraceae bacterium]|nr:hypothetical protein [Saprospiraceae bacterium]MCB9320266.1 hypothetical protein [Lewinellaceae bacterium]